MGLLFLLHLLHLLLLRSAVTAAATPGEYAASFTPQDTSLFWSSEAAGNYTFGFRLVDDGEYILAIWHSLDVNQTAIWWADFGDTNPSSTVKERATLNYTSSRILQLYDSTSSLVWQSGNFSTSTNLQFLDTGNLMLLQENSSTVLWESFEDHRDSLMFTGLTASSLINKPVLLQSRRNQTSYARGRFHMATYNRFDIYLFGLDVLNNEYAYMQDYNVSVNVSGNIVSVGNQLDGSAYVSRNPGLQRLSLDYDANLRVYQWNSSLVTWVKVWELMRDSSLVCRATSPCGPFGLCSVDSANMTNCSCPSGYTPISSEDPSKGCNSTRIPPGCGQGDAGSNTIIVEVQQSDYYYFDYDGFSNIYDIEKCKNSCLSDCACIAATYNSGDHMCFLKGNTTIGYLENGLSSAVKSTLLIKLLQLPDAGQVPPPVQKGRHLVPIIVVAVTMAILAFATAMGLAIWRRRMHTKWSSHGALEGNEAWDAGPRRFSYQELVEATNNFSDLLGEGGFGAVFKGMIRDRKGELAATSKAQGTVMVAVKVLKSGARKKRGVDTTAVKQFRAEAGTLSKIHHINLVTLLGYCVSGSDGEKRLLVYEYMEKGSLDRYLSPAHMREPLPWSMRYSIAVGTARGIAYLHHDCLPRILHCDIKPQNVLLDEHFTPKVADFGLAAYFSKRGQSHLTVSGMRGTRGYMAPDWLKSDAITRKADVYSFGMLLLELVHGLNAESMSLVAWALQCLATDSIIPDHELASAGPVADDEPTAEVAVEDHTIGMALQSTHITEQGEGALEQQLRCLRVALWCVHQVPAQRPSMSQVLHLIDGTRDIENPPDPAAINNIQFFPRHFDSGSISICNNVVSYSVLSAR